MSVFDTAIDLSEVKFSEWGKYIGNGYRSCHYTTDAERNGQIILFGYDVNGNPQTFICPHRSHIKYNVKYPTRETDIFGRYVETRTFANSNLRKKYLESCNGALNIVECLSPEREFLHKMFDHVALDPTFNTQPLRVHTLDIETEMSATFEFPKTARNKINMFTIHDSKTDKFYTWTIGDCEVDFKEKPLCDMPKDKFVIFKFNGDEKRMLLHFLDWYEENLPDVILQFNGRAFDVPYLTNRIERILGNPRNIGTDTLSQVTRRLSPIGRVRVKENNRNNERANKQAEILVDIAGVFLSDALELYRDKFKIKNPLDGGHGLSNIGEAEGLGRKIEHVGSIKDLYLQDFQKFYEYNVRDVDLLKRLDDKCKMTALARLITSFGLSDYNLIYSSIGYLIGSLVMFARTQMGGKIFSSYKATEDMNEKYEGAFVFEPIPGVYRDGIAVVDYNSLYPSTIRATNISPETYIGKISRYPIGNDLFAFKSEEAIDLRTATENKFYLLGANNQQKTISRKELDELLNTKCIFTRNNTLFLKHSVKKGVIAEWCAHFFNLRKATKKEMAKLEKRLYKNEVPENEIPKVKEMIENLDSRQQALKIMINSIYGIIGTAYSPIYNIHMAQTITRTGKFCNISAAQHVADVFNEKFGKTFALPPPPNLRDIVGNNDRAYYICSGDTDSSVSSTNIFIKFPNIHKNNHIEKKISFGEFFQSLLDEGRKIIHFKDYELIYCGDIEIKTIGNKYSPIEYVSRHKTTKHLVKIIVKTDTKIDSVIVTTDHICMVYNQNHFFENTAAKDIHIGQIVSVYDEKSDNELVGEIVSIEDQGTTADYVYDVEVNDKNHAFYADNILIHNSQFISIRCVTDYFRRTYNLPTQMIDWPDEYKLKLWQYMEDFVENDLNKFIQNLVKEYYHTENSEVLRYSLEYIADTGIYEAKKHYGVRKILAEGPEIVDKIKYSGIELKKGNIPPTVKEFLAAIYSGVLRDNWNANNFKNYLNQAYDRFIKLNIDEISFWKGYGTERESVGFLEMAKGTTGIAKACTFYNQLLENLGIGRKYEQILVGDKVRFLYVKPTNKYGINVLAYKPDQYPEEFKNLFEIDYETMWDKLIISPLKKFVIATGFPECDPRQMNLMDVDDL